MRSDVIKKGTRARRTGACFAPRARSATRATSTSRSSPSATRTCDIVPGHVHLQAFARVVKDAIRQAGGIPFEFNTIGVDDGIAMGHDGMRYSLPSRELIADCRRDDGRARTASTR